MFTYDNVVVNMDRLTRIRRSIQRDMLPLDGAQQEPSTGVRKPRRIPRSEDEPCIDAPLSGAMQPGERVDFRGQKLAEIYGPGPGTIVRRVGFGRVLIQLDSGNICKVFTRSVCRI